MSFSWSLRSSFSPCSRPYSVLRPSACFFIAAIVAFAVLSSLSIFALSSPLLALLSFTFFGSASALVSLGLGFPSASSMRRLYSVERFSACFFSAPWLVCSFSRDAKAADNLTSTRPITRSIPALSATTWDAYELLDSNPVTATTGTLESSRSAKPKKARRNTASVADTIVPTLDKAIPHIEIPIALSGFTGASSRLKTPTSTLPSR
mmetsp:Transcript_10361/g.12121  ORF Transcript_10361/g.12121 Transcript_10361/m.12121 type:complete len:207 (-) Transcript_10361:161-781(-)